MCFYYFQELDRRFGVFLRKILPTLLPILFRTVVVMVKKTLEAAILDSFNNDFTNCIFIV